MTSVSQEMKFSYLNINFIEELNETRHFLQATGFPYIT